MTTTLDLSLLDVVEDDEEGGESYMFTPQAIDGIVYDIEIANHIGPYQSDSKVKCCSGWGDYKGMGIAVICAFDFVDMRFRVFLQDNLAEFQRLVNSRKHIIGYNSKRFDDNLCAANGIKVATTYDLCAEIKAATTSRVRSGYSLDRVAEENLGAGKTEDPALIPVLWQRGNVGRVIDYCIEDVNITRNLFSIAQMMSLRDPNTGEEIKGIRRIR